MAPIACTALLAAFGTPIPVVVLLVAMCLVAIACTAKARQVDDSLTAVSQRA